MVLPVSCVLLAPANEVVAQAAASAAPKPLGVPGNWQMMFSDGFSGTSLKLNLWRPNWLGASDRSVSKPVNNAELSCYNPRNVRVAGGVLLLTAQKKACRASNGHTYKYSSGLVESNSDYRFTYGYAETRMYLKPNTSAALGRKGSCAPNWPAFWLNGQHWPADGEMDVMECLGDNVAQHYHWSGGSAGGSTSAWKGNMPGSGGWHVFGVDWRRGSLTFYYDGVKVGSHRTGVTARPHYLVANLGVSGSKFRAQTLKIDYVRVWRRR